MTKDESYSLNNVYKSVKEQINHSIEEESDHLNGIIYDIIQDRKSELEDTIINNIKENSAMEYNCKDINIIVKGHSEYENLNDMIEAIFCDNLKSTYGVD